VHAIEATQHTNKAAFGMRSLKPLNIRSSRRAQIFLAENISSSTKSFQTFDGSSFRDANILIHSISRRAVGELTGGSGAFLKSRESKLACSITSLLEVAIVSLHRTDNSEIQRPTQAKPPSKRLSIVDSSIGEVVLHETAMTLFGFSVNVSDRPADDPLAGGGGGTMVV
jgi:hypothetical protein